MLSAKDHPVRAHMGTRGGTSNLSAHFSPKASLIPLVTTLRKVSHVTHLEDIRITTISFHHF